MSSKGRKERERDLGEQPSQNEPSATGTLEHLQGCALAEPGGPWHLTFVL